MADKAQITRFLILKNGVYSLFSWLFPILLTLIATPIIVKGLGTEAYGLYAIIMGFVSYSFTFGIGKTAAKYVAESRSSGDLEQMSSELSAVLLISLAFGILVIALVAVTAGYLVSDLLAIPAISQKTAVAALYVAGLTILVTMVNQFFQYILQGLHRFDRFLFLTNVSGLILTLGNVAIVLGGYGVLELVYWNLIVGLITAFLFFVVSKRLLPEFKPRFAIDAEVWKRVFGYATSIVAYQIFGNALLLFERAWIVRKFGTQALTFYVVPMALCFYFHGLVSSLAVVLFPVVNQLLNEKEKLVRLYRTSTKLILALTAFFAVTMIIGGRVFLRTWLDDNFATLSYLLLVIHVFTFAIISITTIAWQLTESFGVARLNALAGGLWFLISVPLMVVLSQTWQTEGVAIARLIGVFAFVPLIVYVERRFLTGLSAAFWPKALIRLVVATAIAGASEWVIVTFMVAGWFTLSAMVVAGLTIFAVVLLIAGFIDEEEKATFVNLTSRIRQSVTG